MKHSSKAPGNAQNFESSLEELEQIVHRLEAGDLPLEEALELFERGVRMARTCRERLDTAERRVEILLKGSNGARTPAPFADSESPLTDSEDSQVT